MNQLTTSKELLDIEIPSLSLQVVSFLKIGIYLGLSGLIWLVLRQIVAISVNAGIVRRKSIIFQILNFSSFILPGLFFLYGLSVISRESLFASVLFFVIFSIVLGFVLVEPARNLFSSLILNLRGDLKAGDYVKTKDTEGEIQNIGAFSILIINKSGSRTYVPNHQFLEMPYEVFAEKGGPTMLVSYPTSKITKKNLIRIAHLCPYKRKGSDVRLSTIDNTHNVTLEVINRECRPWVSQFFDNHIG